MSEEREGDGDVSVCVCVCVCEREREMHGGALHSYSVFFLLDWLMLS